MLLTLAKPTKAEFEYKPHEYSPTFYSSSSAPYSPKYHGRPVSSLPASVSSTMAAEHRGLPPPSAMTLPHPTRVQSAMGTGLAALPPAPSQWQGGDEGMKNWLMAKSEEDKRRQEEEKTKQEEMRTKQEGLRLDQRRVEHEMLRESMHGNIPPHLIPLIFAGIGGANIANMTAEWVQQYSAQLQASQQQQHQLEQQQQAQAHGQAQSHMSPELRRNAQGQPGAFGPGPYGGGPQTPQTVIPPATSVLPGQHMPSQQQHTAFTPPSRGGAPTSAPRPFPSSAPSQLPRLNTVEMHIQQPPTATSINQQPQQPPPAQREEESPIYFHHWVPPSSAADKSGNSGNQPATPSGKYKVSSSVPYERPNASDPEYTSSPKKRKLQGGQEAPIAPPMPTWVPPTTIHSYQSPSYSTSSTSTPRRGHGRNRSDASGRATMSRRGTLQRSEFPEGPHGEVSEPQYQPPPQGPEGHYQVSHFQHQEQQQTPAPPLQRNDGRGDGPQARAPSPRAVQGETRQSGPQHPDLRSVPASPKRDVRGHQN